MIPESALNEWRQFVPWILDIQVEQDLILSRALAEIYSVPSMHEKLAFKGGTALHKIHLPSPGRYSDDLDFVQVKSEPIGNTLNSIRAVLDPWLGHPRWDLKSELVKLTYRYLSLGERPMKLKIEINPREHFVSPHVISKPFVVKSSWFSSSVNVTTLDPAWLLASKLMALYGRKKARDLFDTWLALNFKLSTGDIVVANFLFFLDQLSRKISRAEFEKNMFYKLSDEVFLSDLTPLLAPNEQNFDYKSAYSKVHAEIISRLPGEPWKGHTRIG